MMNLIYFYIGFVTFWLWWIVVGWFAFTKGIDYLINMYSEKPEK